MVGNWDATAVGASSLVATVVDVPKVVSPETGPMVEQELTTKVGMHFATAMEPATRSPCIEVVDRIVVGAAAFVVIETISTTVEAITEPGVAFVDCRPAEDS